MRNVPVVSQQDTRMGINVWPGVLGFTRLVQRLCKGTILTAAACWNRTHLQKNVRSDFVNLSNKLEQRVIRKVFQSKLSLSHVSRVLGIPPQRHVPNITNMK